MTLYIYKNNPIHSTSYFTKIAIGSAKVEEIITNEVILSPIPKGKNTQGPSISDNPALDDKWYNPVTRIVDIKKLTQGLTVDGYLSDQSAVINAINLSTFTNITATEAKNYIKKYMVNARTQTGIYWRGAAEDYTIENPTVANIDNRVFWGEITELRFGDEGTRRDLDKTKYEVIKGTYSGTYPGEVKRYKVSFKFNIGTKV